MFSPLNALIAAPAVLSTALSAASQASKFTYYSTRAIFNPLDADAVSAVGEISALHALEHMRRQMMESQTGRYLLQVQPRISDKLLEEARQLPEGTFGRRYALYMDTNQFLPDGRTPVRHIEDSTLSYIMTRYRQCHDFLHTCADAGRTVHEEVAVKLLEYQHTTLPLGLLAVPGGALHESAEELGNTKLYWKWAKLNAPCSVHGKKSIPFYLNHIWEDLLELPMEKVMEITGITPLTEFLAKAKAVQKGDTPPPKENEAAEV